MRPLSFAIAIALAVLAVGLAVNGHDDWWAVLLVALGALLAGDFHRGRDRTRT